MPKISLICSAVSIKHRLVRDRRTYTDGHRPMASTADAQHRAVKNCHRSRIEVRPDVLTRPHALEDFLADFLINPSEPNIRLIFGLAVFCRDL